MCATTDGKSVEAPSAGERLHAQCLLCGPEHPQGLRLVFSTQADGHVEAAFLCDSTFQGYAGCLHGGIISALLDSAMTNRLFARGYVAMTGELTVRFLKPVAVNRSAVVSGRLVKSSPPLFKMEAELRQEQELMARAKAKFMEVKQ